MASSSTRQLRFALKNRPAEFERVVQALLQWRADGVLPADATHDARLVLEEAFTNIVKYAHADGLEHEVALTLTLGVDRLDMELGDDGIPFDPTASKPTAADECDTEPRIGMIGLQLIRSYATTGRYERRAGRNLLSLSKHFSPAG